MEYAESFVSSGMVEPERFRSLVHDIPESAYSRYPALSQRAVREAVEGFLARVGRDRPDRRNHSGAFRHAPCLAAQGRGSGSIRGGLGAGPGTPAWKNVAVGPTG